MNSVKLMIKSNRKRKDGTTPIYIEYRFNRDKKRLFNTRKLIQPNLWNEKYSRVSKSHPKSEEWNAYLLNLKHKLEKILDDARLHGKHATVDYVQNTFESKTGVNAGVEREFWVMFEAFIDSKTGQVGNDTVKDYKSLRKHLTSYEKREGIKMDVSIIDFDFYNKFLFHLENNVVKPNGEIGLQKNSAGKQIKNLKAFLNYCMNRGLIEHIDLSGFKTISIESDNIYLTENDLDNLLQLDLAEDPRLKIIRDIFIIGCETGLRYGDLRRLNWDHFDLDNRLIRCNVSKTLDKVVIPISSRLNQVIHDYIDSGFPSGVHANDINREIKDLAKRANIDESFSKWEVIGTVRREIQKPKYELVSTHTCRRTFCTNQHLKGIQSILIMKISGHRTEKAFLKYIKISGDEAAKKMLEIWDNN